MKNLLFNQSNIVGFILNQLIGAITPLFVVSDTAVHHIKQFKETVLELAGGPDRCMLKETIGFEDCTGEVAYLDGIEPAKDAGRDEALSSLTNRYTLDQIADPSLAQALAALFTGNDEVVGQRTHIAPRKIGVDKWFDSTERNFLQYTDPLSMKMKSLMSGYFFKETQRIMAAIFAATVTRGKDDGTNLTNVAMPASQFLPDYTYADIDYKVFSAIAKRFQINYVRGERIFYGMGPSEWEALVNNSGEILLNKDYVSSARHFDTGELPTVFGVTPVVDPIFEDTTALNALGLLGEGEIALHGAWTENGVCWGEFDPMFKNMDGPMAAHKNQTVCIVEQSANAARRDDLRVLNGAILQAE